ncbi:MAG: pseudouridylate synthase, partial [Cyclobacteriaceae bacterium]|nr:pseudouridylate synthase [Cyclobacteriaceae bacterium]
GVLLFGLNEDINKAMQRAFADKMVSKKYLAIVRGFTEDYGTIDYPLKRENGRIQEAITQYNTLDRAELDIPFGKHQTSRYSLLEINPLTGRYHQIRKHLDHIHHPIIGDRPHGCNKQNKLFKEKFQLMTMMLHARELSFTHPVTNEEIRIVAEIQDEFKRMIRLMKFLF